MHICIYKIGLETEFFLEKYHCFYNVIFNAYRRRKICLLIIT